MRNKNGFHVIVLTSTVMPGSTGGEVRATLEQISGSQAGREFGLCYNPEFIALGSVVRDFLNPDFLLIGESDERSGKILEGIYHRVCDNKPPTSRLTFVDAEIAKLGRQYFPNHKDQLRQYARSDLRTRTGLERGRCDGRLGMDSRIGPRYLKGAISYGGPCFPRDNVALASLAKRVGTPADIAQATDSSIEGRYDGWPTWYRSVYPIAVQPESLALTCKPHTDVVEQAPGWRRTQEIDFSWSVGSRIRSSSGSQLQRFPDE